MLAGVEGKPPSVSAHGRDAHATHKDPHPKPPGERGRRVRTLDSGFRRNDGMRGVGTIHELPLRSIGRKMIRAGTEACPYDITVEL